MEKEGWIASWDMLQGETPIFAHSIFFPLFKHFNV